MKEGKPPPSFRLGFEKHAGREGGRLLFGAGSNKVQAGFVERIPRESGEGVKDAVVAFLGQYGYSETSCSAGPIPTDLQSSFLFSPGMPAIMPAAKTHLSLPDVAPGDSVEEN